MFVRGFKSVVAVVMIAVLGSSCATLGAPGVSRRYPAGMIDLEDITTDELSGVRALVTERVAAGDRVLLFRVNSYGGSITAGLDFIQELDELRKTGVHVQCVVDTKAMSMGLIFLESACDQRMMTRRSVLLAHRGSTRAAGTVEEVQEAAAILEAFNESLAEVMAVRMGVPVAVYKARVEKHAWVVSVAEALRENLIDEVVEPMDLPPVLRGGE